MTKAGRAILKWAEDAPLPITASTTPGTLVLESVLTCPLCGHAKEETMPVDACQWFYECESCKALLTPKAGDCCVFCSYGTNRCPPLQQQSGACCGQ